MGKTYVHELLRFLRVLQGGCEPGKEVALMCFEYDGQEPIA